MVVFRLLLVSLLCYAGIVYAQVPSPGSRVHAGKQKSIAVSDLFLQGTGGAGHVLFQAEADGRVSSGVPSLSSLSDGALAAKLTGPQTLSNTRITPRVCAENDDGTVSVNYDDCNIITMAAVTMATTISNPTGTANDADVLILRACSAAAQTLTLGSQFEATFGIPLPTTTTGSNFCDMWGFSRRTATSKWGIIANTQGTRYGFIHFSPNGALFPAAAPMVLNNAENNPRLLADNTTSQSVYWVRVMPTDYGSTPTFQYVYSMTSIVGTGSHHLDVSVHVCTDSTADCNTDSYDTVNNCNDATVPATAAGYTHTITCSLTTNDSLAAGKLFRLKIARDTANDDAAGVSEILGAMLIYVRN